RSRTPRSTRPTATASCESWMAGSSPTASPAPKADESRTEPLASAAHSIRNGLIGQRVHPLVQCQPVRGMQLGHEDRDHVLLRIDSEPGVVEAAPAKLAR